MRRSILTAAAVAVAVIGSPGLASADDRTYVTPGEVAVTCAAPVTTTFCVFQRGAGTAAIGTGTADGASGEDHLLVSTPFTSNDKAYAFTYDVAGTPLAGITALGYRSWVDPASTATDVQAPALNVEIDRNGGALQDGDKAVLVWEPVYVVDEPTTRGTWIDRSPSTSTGGWWSPADLGFVQYKASWSDVLAALPQATVLGIGPNQGGGNAGLSSQVDLLRINSTVYDFELEEPPPATPTSKDECKGGGWASFSRPVFRNQGECVSFVVRATAAQQG